MAPVPGLAAGRYGRLGDSSRHVDGQAVGRSPRQCESPRRTGRRNVGPKRVIVPAQCVLDVFPHRAISSAGPGAVPPTVLRTAQGCLLGARLSEAIIAAALSMVSSWDARGSLVPRPVFIPVQAGIVAWT